MRHFLELRFWEVPFIVVKKYKREYNKLKMKEVDCMGGQKWAYILIQERINNEYYYTLDEKDLNAAMLYDHLTTDKRKC